MVVAVEPNKELVTAIVPARNNPSNGNQPHRQPVLEIKQKTSSRHEKRTHRDYYRHSGDDKQPPIEYVYTHTEETPKEETGLTSVNGLQNGQSSTQLVPVNENGANKVECSVGEDGNLIVKIRGKPGSVSLDPNNLPVQLPEGWQLKEIRTNQRSRKTERSRKTRIKDETVVNAEDSVVVHSNQQKSSVFNESAQVDDDSQAHFGNAAEEEYHQGEENGVAYVEKKYRKFEKGIAGTTSKIEHIRSEESTDAANTDRKDHYSRNTTSVLEHSENAKRKFSKQSVMDEKVTETHKSDVMYFDEDGITSGPVFAQASRDEQLNHQRTDRQNQNRDESVIVESPDDTPYNSLKRNRQHHSEDTEIVNIEDRYRYMQPDRDHSDNYSREDDVNIVVEKNYRNGGRDSASPRSNLTPSGTNRNNVENTERTNIEEIYRYNYPEGSTGNDRFQQETRREEEVRKYQNSNRKSPGTDQYGNYPLDQVREDVEKTTVEERFNYRQPVDSLSRTEEETRREEEIRKYQNSDRRSHEADRYRNYPLDEVTENVEKTTVEERFNYRQPVDSRRRVDHSEEETRREEEIRRENLSPSDRQNRTFENVEKTTTEDRYQIRQPVESSRETRTDVQSEMISSGKNFKCNYPPAELTAKEQVEKAESEQRQRNEVAMSTYVKEEILPRYTDNTEKTNIEEYYRLHQQVNQPSYSSSHLQPTDESAFPTQARPTSASSQWQQQHASQPVVTFTHLTDERSQSQQSQRMVGTEIRVDGNIGGKSPSPPQDRREQRKDRVTIDDRYRVVGRNGEQQRLAGQRSQSDLSEQRTDQTEFERSTIRNEQRSQSRFTDSSSTGERIIPIGVASNLPQTTTDSRHSSRLSSVDLSEIKPGEHLDNTVLKDRGNLAQVGSLGQRRPPTRNPAKYHFSEDEVLSRSDTTLPHFEAPLYRDRPVSVQVNGYSDADSTAFKRSQTSSVKHQQIIRDERLLLNYVDTDSKPDWVRNIDQHFSGRGTGHIQYNRESVTSPTPRIEEIVTVPGSTVIQVNGEHGEPVHGIVTEPGERPLFSHQPPVDQDLIHQSEKGSRYGFTRLTDSKGYKQAAKEKVQYQERRESVRQISVSYEVPGRGKETREYTWDGVREQPEEKVTFHEERDQRKDVSVNLQLEHPRPVTTTETKQVHQEKIIFDEIREPPKREVAINLKLQTENLEQVRPPPIQSNTFHFEEEIKREREVNFIMGLEQQPVNIRQIDQSHHRANQNMEEIYDIRKEQIERIDYFEPPPKVTFHEDREVTKDVSIQLALENYEAVRQLTPIPVEKIQFEETRVIPAARDVSFVIGLNQPEVHKPITPQRPVSVLSDSTVVTQQIVPQIKRFNEEIRKVETFERIEEIVPPPPKRFHEEVKKVEKYEEIVELAANVDIQPPSARLTAVTEIIPPLPRKVSLQTAAEALEIHHTEVEHVPAEKDSIFQTSVAYQPHEKREHAETEIQMEPIKPKPLPPTSGRVEKHVNLEKIVPEPTGQPLPQSLGTYGYTYTATLEPKKPEMEPSIEFQPPESKAVVEEVEEAQRIDWYVKPGRVPSLIPDDVSSIGEARAATPPRHPELIAKAEIVPPTRLEAITEIYPPKPKIMIDVEIESPPRQFYYGEEEEDRLSVSESYWEEMEKQKPASPPVPVKPERYRNELSKPVPVTADASHHTELKFSTPEEEERWRSSMERHALPRPNRAETSVHLEQPEQPPVRLPSTSGRVVKKVRNEKLETEATGRPLPQSLGTYGFIYMTHVNPQTVIRGKPIEVFEAGVAKVDLDIQQVLMYAITDIEPPLTVQQETQLLQASVKIFPPLTVHQQERLLHALVEIFPPLTPDQQRQLLTGSEDISPPLTGRQQQQLATVSAEIIPPMSPKQQKDLLYCTTMIEPPLNSQQLQHLLTCITEIFPSPKLKKTDKLIEKFESARQIQEEEKAGLVKRKDQRDVWERSQLDRDIVSRRSHAIVEKDFPLDRPADEMESQLIEESQVDVRSRTSQETRPTRTDQRRTDHVGKANQLHHTEMSFSTSEEEERWRSQLDRQSVARPSQTQTAAQLELVEIGTASTSGRIPKKTWNERLEKENTSDQQSIGIYTFVSMTHVNPETPIRGKPIELFEAGVALVSLDVHQVLLSAASQIHPALTVQQERQLLQVCSPVIPVVNIEQQECLLQALIEAVSPPLTPDQQRQLLTGCEVIVPPLTIRQQQQLAAVGAELIPPLSARQQKELLYTTGLVEPPLSNEQRVQFMTSIAEIFQIRKTERIIEEFETSIEDEEDEERTIVMKRKERDAWERSQIERDIVSGSSHPVVEKDFPIDQQKKIPNFGNRSVDQSQTERKSATSQRTTTSEVEKYDIGAYGFLNLVHVNPQMPIRGKPIELFDAGVAHLYLDIQRVFSSASTRVQPPLTKEQKNQLLEVNSRIFPPLTINQQERLLHGLVNISPPLTDDQQRQLLTGSSEVSPPLTSRQQQQLAAISAEIIAPMSTKQQKDFFYACTMLKVPLTRDQQNQLLLQIEAIFPQPKVKKTDKLIEKFESSKQTEDEEETTIIAKRKGRINERGVWERSQHDTHVQSSTPLQPFEKDFPLARRSGLEKSEYSEESSQVDRRSRMQLEKKLGHAFRPGKEMHVGYGKMVDFEGKSEAVSVGSRALEKEEPEDQSDSWNYFPDRVQIFGGSISRSKSMPELSSKVFEFGTYQERVKSGRDYSQLTFKSPSLEDDLEIEYDDDFSSVDLDYLYRLEQSKSPTFRILDQWRNSISESGLNSITKKFTSRSFREKNEIYDLATFEDRISEGCSYAGLQVSSDADSHDIQEALSQLDSVLANWNFEVNSDNDELDFKRRHSAYEITSFDRRISRGFSYKGLVHIDGDSDFEDEEEEMSDVVSSSKVNPRDIFSRHRLVQSSPKYRRRHTFQPGKGAIERSKDMSLEQRRTAWLTEQRMDIEDEEQDLEVSAISMNVKPRIKSQVYMSPSPPLRTCLSPSLGGFQYAASPQMGTPPITEFSGFMYEAPVDGHGSPMNPELGLYGFTYQTTLDGSEPYRKLIEGSKTELDIRATSFRTEEPPKSMSVTPPWSTPPVTPTPVMATSTPGSTTPLPSLKELPEPSSNSAFKKPDQNVESPWGRNVLNKDITQDASFEPVQYTFKTDQTHRQEVRGEIGSPVEEVHEKITETVKRRVTADQHQRDRIGVESSAAKEFFHGKEPVQGGKVEIVTEKDTTEEIVKNYKKHTRTETTTDSAVGSRSSSSMDDRQKVIRPTSKSPSRYHANPAQLEKVSENLRKSDENTYKYLDARVDQVHRNAETVLTQPQFPEHVYTFATKDPTSRSEVYGNLLSPEEEVHEKITETVSRRRYEERSPSRERSTSRERLPIDPAKLIKSEENLRKPDEETYRKLDQDIEKIQVDAQKTLTEGRSSRKVTTVVEQQPEWVKQAEERKRRQVPNLSFRPDKYAKKEVPRLLEVTKEEDSLEALLERSSVGKAKNSPDTSPSSLRKWGNVQTLSPAPAEKPQSAVEEDSISNKTYRRRTTETKNVVEESRFHSEQGLLDALNNPNESNLTSTMSQSLPSLAHLRRMDSEQLGQFYRQNPDAISMEELRKTNRTVKTLDADEEEMRDISYAKRADLGPLETHRTKRIVVRKLVDGEWKDVAVHEEDIPVNEQHILPAIEHPTDRLLADLQRKDDDEWSLTDAVIEETTTTRTIRRVEEEEEDVISLASTDISGHIK